MIIYAMEDLYFLSLDQYDITCARSFWDIFVISRNNFAEIANKFLCSFSPQILDHRNDFELLLSLS